MEIKDLKTGQKITALYWFRYHGYSDCASITGIVRRKLDENAEVEVISSSPSWFDGQKVWIDHKTEILSINN